MKIEEYASKFGLDIKEFKSIAQYVVDELDVSREDRVAFLKSLVEDSEIALSNSPIGKFLSKLQKSTLFEKYYSNWGKYRRSALKETHMNYTFEAIQYFNKLLVDLDKLMTTRQEKTKDAIIQDVLELKKWVGDTIQICISNDGVISSEEFDTFYGVLYGIYEGMLSFIGKIQKDKVDAKYLEKFRGLTKNKAFRGTLIRPEESLDIIKGLFSLGAHLVITAQNNEELKEDSLNLVNDLLNKIAEFIETKDKKVLDGVIF